MKEATDVVIGGCSAGGTLLSLSFVKDLISSCLQL
jgi:hypothetical protein